MYTMKIMLPEDRAKPGILRLFEGPQQTLVFDAQCLGKADNLRAADKGNPARDPARPYGDTPTGEYGPTRWFPFAQPHPRMGDGWIPLSGISGQAEDAVRNGRTGLGIHAGRGDGRLVPTYGCVRMRDADMARLAEIVGDREIRVEIYEELAA